MADLGSRIDHRGGSPAAVLEPDYVVIGGGNVAKLKSLPPNARRGDNANAFKGGFALWVDSSLQV